MKFIVVADKSGNVAATYRPPEKPGKDDPIFRFHPLPGQSIHELELSDDYGLVESAEELHQRIGNHLRSIA